MVSKEGSGLYYLNKKYEGLRLINYIMTLIVFAQLNFNYWNAILFNWHGHCEIRTHDFLRSSRFQDECHKPDSTKYP